MIIHRFFILAFNTMILSAECWLGLEVLNKIINLLGTLCIITSKVLVSYGRDLSADPRLVFDYWDHIPPTVPALHKPWRGFISKEF